MLTATTRRRRQRATAIADQSPAAQPTQGLSSATNGGQRRLERRSLYRRPGRPEASSPRPVHRRRRDSSMEHSAISKRQPRASGRRADDSAGLWHSIVDLSTAAKAEPVARGRSPDAPVARLAAASAAHRAMAPIAARHGLRIDPGSLRSFGKHIVLLAGQKLEQLRRHRASPSTAIQLALAISIASPPSRPPARGRSSTSPSRSPVPSSPTA